MDADLSAEVIKSPEYIRRRSSEPALNHRRGSEPVVRNVIHVEDTLHPQNVLSELNLYREEKKFTDAILCVEDHQFPCHRNVLAVSSPVFHAMFSNEMKERHAQMVTLKEISPSIMELILNYVYSGSVDVTVGNAQDLLAAANYLSYPKITRTCCQILNENLTVANCLGIEKFAQIHSCHGLEMNAHNFALENFRNLIQQEEYKQLSNEQLLSYISSNELDVQSEVTVYESVMQWVSFDAKQRTSQLPKLLSAIRFSEIPFEYIKDVIEVNPLIQRFCDCVKIVSQATQNKQLRTSLPRPSTIVKETLIVIGGISADQDESYSLQDVVMYDITKNKWNHLDDLPVALMFFSCSALNNEIYVTGGIIDHKASSQLFIFRDRQWICGVEMLQPRARHTSCSYKDKLYLFGGSSNVEKMKNAIEAIECFNPSVQQWTVIGLCPMPRLHSQIVVCNGTFVEIGGTQDGASQNTIESYICSDEGIRCSGEKFLLPDCIQFSQVVVIAGALYIIWLDKKTMVVLHPEKRTSRTRSCLRHSHIQGNATVLDGKIYVSGGHANGRSISNVEVYDPVDDSWTAIKSMPQRCACHGSITIEI